jgi:hypothetical protein
MEIENIKIEVKLKMYNSPKRTDIKAYVTLIFQGKFLVNGFTIRTSSRNPESSKMSVDSYWLARPMSGKFTFFNTTDNDFWEQLERAVIERFIDDQIPIVEVEQHP